MEAEDWMRIKLPDQKRVQLKQNTRKQRTGRDIIFQTLLPCVLCFLITYYIFEQRPQVGHFLSAKILRGSVSHQHLPQPSNERNSPKADRFSGTEQSAWV